MAVADPDPDRGIYLVRDDKHLYRVVSTHEGELLLENAGTPSAPLVAITAGDLRSGAWRSVKPAA